MDIKEASWIRSTKKLCPKLKRTALQLYRPSTFTPCFMQKVERGIRQRWRKIPVVIQLESGEIKSTTQLSSLTGCKVKRNLACINSFSTDVTENKLKELIANINIKKIWLDGEVKALLNHASPTVRAPGLWAKNLTGKNIGIAILDTGVYDHPDLAGRITGFKDFIGNRTSPYDDNGHGTHVAGCAASNGGETNYKGPAPESEIVGVKVLNKSGSGSFSTVIQGVQWCIENKDRLKIKIINLSLGGEAYQSYRDDPICQAVKRAWDAGIVVCAAAGNSGPGQMTIDSPGIHPEIITVGASNDRNSATPSDNTVAVFSSRGPTIDGLNKPDLLAPGVDIVSLRSPRSQLDKSNKEARIDRSYIFLSGTSMATPICAGIVAQLLQEDDTLSPSQVKALLMETATSIPNIDSNSQGAGIIDGLKALGPRFE